ncbi:hypothetical protein Prum_085790 [Phytohabitans rumicis]|uniref:Uncharacterized protein n=1 Tax=Phytohabitans rumicis TaxID=1076125 RepID=A0A6V8LLI2_9ACTN|nr:hypothetical protein Prum_085790 [Phytohabitans rumicis]
MLQATVTLPTWKLAVVPATREALKLCPAGVTVVEDAASAGAAGTTAREAATSAARTAARRRVGTGCPSRSP